METSLRCLLISDFNAQNCAAYLENDEDLPAVEVDVGPFGQVMQILADPAHAAWRQRPDVAFVWTLPQRLLPAFQRFVDHQTVTVLEILGEVEQFAQLIAAASEHLRYMFVASWAQDPGVRSGGMTDWQPGKGRADLLARMNLLLAEQLAGKSNVVILDSQRWTALAGKEAYNDKLWFQGKIPFNNEVFLEAVGDLKAALRGFLGQARKLIVLDLDETLWGGIVGDVGMEGLKLGGHDAIGEAYAEFQRALKTLTRQGLVLGIVSKNDEAVALAAIRQHPEMQLRLDDFAGWRINWDDKARNLVELATELNLGLQSVVFIDDNPAERARVREALPEVLVPPWPENPLLYRRALLSLQCFDTPSLSEEDRQRTQAYVSERQRSELKRQVGSLDDWLSSLEIVATAEPLGAANLARATQLLNKTNQMNLATRRMSEAELQTWGSQPGQAVWVFRVSDKLGDSGLTGLASLRVTADQAHVVDFVLSCRVMGRRVEEIMASWLVDLARQAGAGRVVATYLPTAKNKPCLEFWQRSGFRPAEGHVFYWETAADFAKPACIRLTVANLPGFSVHPLGRQSHRSAAGDPDGCIPNATANSRGPGGKLVSENSLHMTATPGGVP